MSILKTALRDRLKGKRPSAPRAMLAAVAVGVTAASYTYKALRA